MFQKCIGTAWAENADYQAIKYCHKISYAIENKAAGDKTNPAAFIVNNYKKREIVNYRINIASIIKCINTLMPKSDNNTRMPDPPIPAIILAKNKVKVTINTKIGALK